MRYLYVSNQRKPLSVVVKVVVDVGRVIMLHVGPHVLVIEHKVNFVVEQRNRLNGFA